MFTRDVRRSIGCGYEEPMEGARPYWPPGAAARQVPPGEWPGPTICVGYTTKLPAVRETTWLQLHWQRGTLKQKLGAEPDESDFARLETFEQAQGECQSWAYANPPKAKP